MLMIFHLQRLLYNFHLSCLEFIIKISVHKTKAINVSCKLEIDGRMVEQVMEFNYLSVNITSSGNLVKEIKTQVQIGAKVADCVF